MGVRSHDSQGQAEVFTRKCMESPLHSHPPSGTVAHVFEHGEGPTGVNFLG